jgi:ISXO2-like transposase domain
MPPPTVPRRESLSRVFYDEDACIQYLIENQIILRVIFCDSCRGNMTLRMNKKIYRCTTHSCRKEKPLRHDSFFTRSKLPLRKIMQIGYDWLLKTPSTSIVSSTGCSSGTVSSFLGYFRQLVASSLDEEDMVIGGENVTVEIDECKLGKRKYNRGHRVDGLWILGGVERTEARRCFLVEVADRSPETLLSVISEHVAPGSLVLTDCWKGYLRLSNALNVAHMTVNHSQVFVDPNTGCCTNTIEGTWNGVRLSIPPRQRTSQIAPDCLFEFIWRRKNASNLWRGLIEALKNISYPND